MGTFFGGVPPPVPGAGPGTEAVSIGSCQISEWNLILQRLKEVKSMWGREKF